jgi:hypothetical protein
LCILYFGISYAHDGIKALLADYFMAKYVLQVNTNFGPFGATNKAPQDGEIADRNSLKDITSTSCWCTLGNYKIIFNC